VLDGAITILDGGKGVEAQTVKVWRQAEKRGTPKICFVNKLDRIGSSVQRTAEAIEALLNVEPLIFQMPVGQGEHFKGVIDLLTMKEHRFGGQFGDIISTDEVKQGHSLFEEAKKKRESLI
jgi:elongation factor G